MASGWTSSIKVVSRSGHTIPGSNAAAFGFTPPPLPTNLTIAPAALFAAMAKMQALKTANIAVTRALIAGLAALTEVLVDDAGTEFDLIAEFEQLEETIAGFLIGAAGAGVCHLALCDLGYVWSAHAAGLVPKRSNYGLADFVYDGGPAAGYGIVLAEAKGSFSGSVDAAKLQSDVDAKYRRQVDSYVGTALPGGSTIVHGYAVGFGAQTEAARRTKGRPNAFLHIAEADAAAVAAAPGGGPPTADTLIALANYRAVFVLMQAAPVVGMIDWLTGADRSVAPERAQKLVRVAVDGLYLLLTEEESRFGIEEGLGARFLAQLSDMYRNERLWERLEARSVSGALVPESPDGLVLFPDGFARPPRSAKRIGVATWSPREGVWF